MAWLIGCGALLAAATVPAANETEVTASAELIRATCMISTADARRSIALGTWLLADFAGVNQGPGVKDVTLTFRQCGVGGLETMSVKTSYLPYVGAPRLLANKGSAGGIGLNVVFASTQTSVADTRNPTALYSVATPIYEDPGVARILLKANLVQATPAAVSPGSVEHALLLEFSYQ